MNLPFEYDRITPGAFAGIPPTPEDFDEARVVILPVPLDRTTSYVPGTRTGPHEILVASSHMEWWDEETRTDVHGIGIATLPEMELPFPSMDEVMREIQRVASEVVAHGKFPVVLGGEHSITPPVVAAVAARHKNLSVLQIDAHADLRDAYEGNKYSHASVMRRVVEAGIPLVSLGVRAFCEEERDARRKHKVLAFDANEIVPNNVSKIKLPGKFPSKVFFTLDVDGMDPSVLPATGTPVPGGLGWYQTLGLFESVARQRRIIGFDIMEYAPIPTFHAYDFAAALLTYKLMGIVQRR